MSTRLFLVRHGESVWNAQGRAQGQANPPLSAIGISQASALATALGARLVAAIYCSPLARARATAIRIAVPHGLAPRVIDDLREVHLGAWQGRVYSDLGKTVANLANGHAGKTADQPGRVDVDPSDADQPGGETLAEARARVAPAIEALLAAHAGETVVVVAHSIIGRVIVCHLLGAGLDLVPRLKLKQASISLLRLDDGVVLERLGDISHLRSVTVTGRLGYEMPEGAQS